MILDGYSLNGTVDGVGMIYRPALDLERRQVYPTLRFHQNESLKKIFLRRHIYWSSLPLDAVKDEALDGMFLVCLGVMPPETGGDWSKNWEQRDAQNLYDGVKLELTAPRYARRDCGMCQKWWYDEETGQIVERGGKQLKRPAGSLTLCQTDEGCPKGTPDKPKGLSPKNRLAYKAYQGWKATGEFPDDQIVFHNASIIERAIRDVEILKERERQAANARRAKR